MRQWRKRVGALALAVTVVLSLFLLAGCKGKPLPEGMETQTQLYDRARRVLDTIARTFPGRRVLLVTHGFFARFILATHAGTGFRSITPMDNAEVRCITLP